MEEQEIGGIPVFISALAPLLPRDQVKRKRYIRIFVILLTFVTHGCFAAARKPLTIVQLKVAVECNITTSGNLKKCRGFETNSTGECDDFPKWCSGGWWKDAYRGVEYMMGDLLALFLILRGVSSFGCGVIADMINPRYFLSAGCFLTGTFTVFLGLTERWDIPNYEYLGTIMSNFAVCQSMSFPILLACTNDWYDGQRRGLFFSIWNINHYLGNLLGAVITIQFIDDDSWGWCFFVPAMILIVVGLVNWLFLVVHPSDLKALDHKSQNKQNQEESEMELPKWLDPSRGINFMQALTIPGVIEYSSSMFFFGVTRYFFSYVNNCYFVEDVDKIPYKGALYSLTYAFGAVIGGLLAGILKDMFKKSALLCICILAISLPVIYLQLFLINCDHQIFSEIFHFILGIFVETPHILLSTSVSVDLGTHRMIKRGVRGLSTVAGIVAGSELIGSSLAPILYIYVIKLNFRTAVLILPIFQLLAALSLLRMAIRDYKADVVRVSLSEYLNTQPRPAL